MKTMQIVIGCAIGFAIAGVAYHYIRLPYSQPKTGWENVTYGEGKIIDIKPDTSVKKHNFESDPLLLICSYDTAGKLSVAGYSRLRSTDWLKENKNPLWTEVGHIIGYAYDGVFFTVRKNQLIVTQTGPDWDSPDSLISAGKLKVQYLNEKP